MFATKYRVSRDRVFPRYWAVQYRFWWLPFWIEHGNGMLPSKSDAEELIDLLKDLR